MTRRNPQKRHRHVPQHGASHVYWSERSKGKVFEVRHPSNGDGKRLYEVVGPRLDEAKARAREVYGDDSPRLTNVGLTFAEALADWRKSRTLSPDYESLIRVHIEPRWRRVKVREIRTSDIPAWLHGLARHDGKPGPLAEGSKRLVLAVFSEILEHAVGMAGGSNPCKQLKKGQRPRQGEPRRRILSPGEEARLYAYSVRFPWLADVVTVALQQALRLGEVLGLQWEDVDLEQNKLRVRHALGKDGELGPTKHTKLSGKRDLRDLDPIDLMPQAAEVLRQVKPLNPSGFVFLNTLGNKRERRAVQRAFEKTVERAALPVSAEGKVVFHSLRHTCISRLANDPRVGIVYAQQFAGHTDIKTTMSYVKKVESAATTSAAAEALTGEGR